MPPTVYANRYAEPVNKLLTLGDSSLRRPEWHDYSGEGLSTDDLPALKDLASDEELFFGVWPDPAAFGPIHAWRALGALQATEAFDVLAMVIIEWGEDDWVISEMPTVIARLGPPVLEKLVGLYNRPGADSLTRSIVVESIGAIGQRFSASIPDCTAVLIPMLENFEDNEDWLNAELIHSLTQLRAVESVPLIEKVFAADCVDLSVAGDWESAQIELGLLDERITPEPHWMHAEMARSHAESADADDIPDGQARSSERAAAEKKRKQARKQTKATKKKQRKSKKKKKRK